MFLCIYLVVIIFIASTKTNFLCTYTLYMASFNNEKWTGRTLIYLLLLLLFHCSSSLSFIAVEEYADAVTHMCTIQMMIMCRRHHRPHQLDYALIFQSFMIYKNVVDMVLSSENPAHFPSLFLLIHIYVFRFIDIYYIPMLLLRVSSYHDNFSISSWRLYRHRCRFRGTL